MKLDNREKNRYSRHLLLKEVGEAGQEKLKAARVLVVGAGGLGCPVLQYLTAAGVGTIGIIDFDTVEATNLHRQVLFNDSMIGQNKASTAKKILSGQNPLINIYAYDYKLTSENALEIINTYDLIVDGSDNFSTRYLVNDACVILEKPFVYGAIYRFEGQVSVFNYRNGPSYRCLFPEIHKGAEIPNCAEAGVIGILPGIIGALQANEVLKIILNIGKPLSGKILFYNSLTNESNRITIQKNESEFMKIFNNKKDFHKKKYDYACTTNFTDTENIKINKISVNKLKKLIAQKEDIVIIDVRQPEEQPKLDKLNVLNYPVENILKYAYKIDKNKTTIVFCQSGQRSRAAIAQLKSKYGFENLLNLEGGINEWVKDKNSLNKKEYA